MRYVILLLMPIALIAVDLGAIQPEQYDWSAYVAGGQTTCEQRGRIEEALNALSRRAESVIVGYATRIDADAAKLLVKSQADWMTYAQSRAAFLADGYRGGTIQGVVAGACLVESYVSRILELLSYEKGYFEP